MSKSGWKKLRKPEYDKIKALLDAGVSINKTAEVMGRSVATVAHISKSNSLKEYRELANPKPKTEKVEKPAPGVEVDTVTQRLDELVKVHMATLELVKEIHQEATSRRRLF